MSSIKIIVEKHDERINEDKTRTPMTIPNHRTLRGSTLRSICMQAGISRDEFLSAYEDS